MITFKPAAFPQTPDEVRRALDDAYWRGRADEARDRAMTAGVMRPARPSPECILAAVGAVTGMISFCKRTRSRSGHRERLIAALLLREECRLSYPAIANLLGYKHHSGIFMRMAEPLDVEMTALLECARQHLRAARPTLQQTAA